MHQPQLVLRRLPRHRGRYGLLEARIAETGERSLDPAPPLRVPGRLDVFVEVGCAEDGDGSIHPGIVR